MRRPLETLVFVALAGGLHLAVWPQSDAAGLEAAGDGGENLLSIRAASSSVEQLVAEWDAPPQALEGSDSPTQPAQPQVPLPRSAPAVAGPDPQRQASPQRRAPAMATSAPDRRVASQLPPPPRPAPPTAASKMAPMVVPDLPTLDQAPPLPVQRAVQRPPTAPQLPAAQMPLTKAESLATQEPPAPAKPAAAQPRKTAKTTAPAKKAPTAAPAKTASAASSGAVAKRAAGSGNKQAAGKQGTDERGTLSKKKRASLMAKWGASIRARIARKVPRGSGKGTAYIRITVNASGALISAKLQKSSGSGKIDKIALNAVRRAAPFTAAPKGLGKNQMVFSLPISSR